MKPSFRFSEGKELFRFTQSEKERERERERERGQLKSNAVSSFSCEGKEIEA